MPRALQIVGTQEVAKMMGVSVPAISRWRRLGAMPPADKVLAMGPVWRTSTIKLWKGKVDHEPGI